MNVKEETRRERITFLTRENPTINSKKIRRDALGMRTYDIGFMLFRCLLEKVSEYRKISTPLKSKLLSSAYFLTTSSPTQVRSLP